MSYKIATYTTLFLITILSLIFFMTALEYSVLQSNQPVNPATFPQIICILLIIMCAVSFFTTKKSKDEKLEMPNFLYVVYTVALLVVFLLLWELVGYFYLMMVLLFAALFYLYDPNPNLKKKAVSAIAYAVLVGTIVYAIFNTLLGVIF